MSRHQITLTLDLPDGIQHVGRYLRDLADDALHAVRDEVDYVEAVVTSAEHVLLPSRNTRVPAETCGQEIPLCARAGEHHPPCTCSLDKGHTPPCQSKQKRATL